MSQKRFLVSLFIIFYSLIFVVVYASDTSNLEKIVERIQGKYNEIKDITGRFSQTSYIKDLERVEHYKGEFFIRKPSSMRWVYSKPRDEEVIIREGEIWIYKKSEKQAIKSAFSKDAYGQVPIALLNSLGNLKADYEIRLIKDDTLELKPRQRMGYIDYIVLEVNDHDFPIKAFSIFDTYGNKIDIKIKDIKTNSGLSDSLFVFKPGPGVEVFDLNQ
jgi:outer membrane lipoprotein carrier protein